MVPSEDVGMAVDDRLFLFVFCSLHEFVAWRVSYVEVDSLFDPLEALHIVDYLCSNSSGCFIITSNVLLLPPQGQHSLPLLAAFGGIA